MIFCATNSFVESHENFDEDLKIGPLDAYPYPFDIIEIYT